MKLLFKVSITLLLFATLTLQAQHDCDNTYFPTIEKLLSDGDCDRAEGIYGVYKTCSGRANSSMERRIAECRRGKGGQAAGPAGTRGKETFTVNGVSFTMVYVEGGTFTMGATSEQGEDCDSHEKPAHRVTLSGYSIGQTEVTQALWRAVMGGEPTYNGGWTTGNGRGNSYPAYYVSYDDVQTFIRRLNQKTGRTFRLPTEAEWEYAARGGGKSRGYKYSGGNDIGAVAWHGDNGGNKTHPVAQKQPNELGLYDMSGNVWEWCSDWYGSDYYSSSPQNNPGGPSSGARRVARGGGWSSFARFCRVPDRFSYSPAYRDFYLGFRLVLES